MESRQVRVAAQVPDTRLPAFRVFGEHGELVVHAQTGEVLEYDAPLGEDGYNDIVLFDVAEWHETYPGESIEGTRVDILDLGYWVISGAYEAAEADWRAEMRFAQEEVH